MIGPEGIKIGRHSQNNIVLRDKSISRFHAEIYQSGGETIVRDTSSIGTLVNGQPVQGQQALRNGDSLSIGGVTFQFSAAPGAPAPAVVPPGAAVPGRAAPPGRGAKPKTPVMVWGMLVLVVGVVAYALIMSSMQNPYGTSPNAPPLQIVPVTTEPPVGPAPVVEDTYCPSSGAVILYWNPGYDCRNGSGDTGYRLLLSNGTRDVNNGPFDNQASSIHIPPGWSVELWEQPGLKGGKVCVNKSYQDLGELADFPGTTVAVNDNASSMRAFRNATCREDWNVGTKSATWPNAAEIKNHKKPRDPNSPPPACEYDITCNCMPDELTSLIEERQSNDRFILDSEKFNQSYFNDYHVEGEMIVMEFNNYGIHEELTKLGIYPRVVMYYEVDCKDDRLDDTNQGLGRYPVCKPSAKIPNLAECTMSDYPLDDLGTFCPHCADAYLAGDCEFTLLPENEQNDLGWEIGFDYKDEVIGRLICGQVDLESPMANQGQCSQFDAFRKQALDVVYPDWKSGTPLVANIKMPEGVDWQDLGYELAIGGASSTDCEPWVGSPPTRLSCEIDLPSRCAGNLCNFTLFTDGCTEPIKHKELASMPGTLPTEKEKKDEPEETCHWSLPPLNCLDAGGSWDPNLDQCSCN